MTKRLFGYTVTFLVLLHTSLTASNIEVSGVSLSRRDTVTGRVTIRCNVRWSNSWRHTSGIKNWDAAWIFAKFRLGTADISLTGASSSGTNIIVPSTANLRVGMPVIVTGGTGVLAVGTVVASIINSTVFSVNTTPTTALSGASIRCVRIWEHVRLTNSGNSVPSNFTAENALQSPTSSFDSIANPVVGLFVYRSTAGTGTATADGVELRWCYVANGISAGATVDVQVFAIEMVYIPGGTEFLVGGSAVSQPFYPTTINTATATVAPLSLGNRGGFGGGFPAGTAFTPTTAAYPNGFNAVYCMKYEISQGQYRDFLNTLTRNQQLNRVGMATATVGLYAGGRTWNGTAFSGGEVTNLTVPTNRIGLRLASDPGSPSPLLFACDLNSSSSLPNGVNQSDDGEWIAMGQLTYMDGCAYLDWACLRPMTEIEFEKICRGDQDTVSQELATGDTVFVASNGISQSGTISETSTTSGARFAANNRPGQQGPIRVGAFAGPYTSRGGAGATYYGVMEMSGNLWEPTVGMNAITYTGAHGDGTLSNNGHANTALWPGNSGGNVTSSMQTGFRGGSWLVATYFAVVCDRSRAYVPLMTRDADTGMRGVRSQ